jgi:glucose/mannose-6-phosphate isomerase
MKKTILNFTRQLNWDPEASGKIQNKNYKKVIICGMGGSHLGADILKMLDLKFEILVHKNYGLPNLNLEELKKSLIILDSYSGNTEEVISSFLEAQKLNLNFVIIASGGKLIELAKKFKKPYIQIPYTGIQPRHALGFQILALLYALNLNHLILDIKKISSKINILNLEKKGKILAKELKNSVPIIYASQKNEALAYNWKIKFNETSKIPAFYNVFPELNHNEMQGMDVMPNTKELSKNFYFLMFYDENDYSKIKTRMKITNKLYLRRGLKTKILNLNEKNIWLKIFNNLLLGDWTSYYLSQIYKTEPEQVPMVEEFKKLLA